MKITLYEHLQLVRVERDKRLSATDWSVLPDSPLSDDKKNQYIEYRNALRDLPSQVKDVEEVNWPIKPA